MGIYLCANHPYLVCIPTFLCTCVHDLHAQCQHKYWITNKVIAVMQHPFVLCSSDRGIQYSTIMHTSDGNSFNCLSSWGCISSLPRGPTWLTIYVHICILPVNLTEVCSCSVLLLNLLVTEVLYQQQKDQWNQVGFEMSLLSEFHVGLFGLSFLHSSPCYSFPPPREGK